MQQHIIMASKSEAIQPEQLFPKRLFLFQLLQSLDVLCNGPMDVTEFVWPFWAC
jgi:hypothetical protein